MITSPSPPSTPSRAGSSASPRSTGIALSSCSGIRLPIACSAPQDPLDKTIKIGGRHFKVVGVSKKKGSVFGQSQDEFADHPARSVSEDLRFTAEHAVPGEAPHARGGQGRHGRCDGGDAGAAAARAEGTG